MKGPTLRTVYALVAGGVLVIAAAIGLIMGSSGGVPGGGHMKHNAASPAPAGKAGYANEQARAIAALSDTDIADLKAGRGWGMAKPAEFRGYPGPTHVLELAKDLALTPAQTAATIRVMDAMRTAAIATGDRYIKAEATLDQAFRDRSITAARLAALIASAERERASLRQLHLAAHLQMTPILTTEQQAAYAKLRGYAPD